MLLNRYIEISSTADSTTQNHVELVSKVPFNLIIVRDFTIDAEDSNTVRVLPSLIGGPGASEIEYYLSDLQYLQFETFSSIGNSWPPPVRYKPMTSGNSLSSTYGIPLRIVPKTDYVDVEGVPASQYQWRLRDVTTFSGDLLKMLINTHAFTDVSVNTLPSFQVFNDNLIEIHLRVTAIFKDLEFTTTPVGP